MALSDRVVAGEKCLMFACDVDWAPSERAEVRGCVPLAASAGGVPCMGRRNVAQLHLTYIGRTVTEKIRTYTGTVAITMKYTVSMIYTRTPPVGEVEFRSNKYTFELNLNRSGAG